LVCLNLFAFIATRNYSLSQQTAIVKFPVGNIEILKELKPYKQ
jgi:hypothetical protein